MITIHGGGWHYVGPGMIGFEFAEDARLNSWGWATLNVDYRARAPGYDDVQRFYDRLRAQVGPRTPICLDGDSAGGQLALMVAVRRRDVACVIARAAPSDLLRLPPRLTAFAEAAFDDYGGLKAWSPARRNLSLPVLAVCARNDGAVPCNQVTSLTRHNRRAVGVFLDPGTARFVHSTVDREELQNFYVREAAFLRRVFRRYRVVTRF